MSDALADRIAEIRKRLKDATPAVLDVEVHGHPLAGCKCMSCDVMTGYRLDHDSWQCCDEHPDMQAGITTARQRGKVQEHCYVAPIPYADAVLAAHAYNDLSFLLNLIRVQESAD